MNAMNLNRFLPAWVLAGWTLVSVGCVSPPTEVRVQGVLVPGRWLELAEYGSGSEQAQACLSLSRTLWDRDVLESLRYLRKGAEFRSAECGRRYLSSLESETVNVSQRVYGRLFIEGLLRTGPLPNDAGEDIRGDLYTQLGWAWSHTEPVSLFKARQVLEAMVEGEVEPSSTSPAFVAQLFREVGLPAFRKSRGKGARQEIQLYAGEVADESRHWLQMTAAGKFPSAVGWSTTEAVAWGGGSDRLLQASGVLAFLVNSRGEPSFRGDRLWICNLGSSAVYLTSLAVGRSNHELLPGTEEILPLPPAGFKKADPTTGIPLSIRFRRPVR
jgi:hypothetical protein